MTWKEFKMKVEAQGVRDADEISYIDISSGFPDVAVSFTQDREFSVE